MPLCVNPIFCPLGREWSPSAAFRANRRVRGQFLAPHYLLSLVNDWDHIWAGARMPFEVHIFVEQKRTWSFKRHSTNFYVNRRVYCLNVHRLFVYKDVRAMLGRPMQNMDELKRCPGYGYFLHVSSRTLFSFILNFVCPLFSVYPPNLQSIEV